MVPDGVEEVELAKVNLEQQEREQKLLLDDIRRLSLYCETSGDIHPRKEVDLWMITGGRSTLVRGKTCEHCLRVIMLILDDSLLLNTVFFSMFDEWYSLQICFNDL